MTRSSSSASSTGDAFTSLKQVSRMAAEIARKRALFHDLHQHGCFVLPNPWDRGGVARLERAGAVALASSSAACAWALGLDDGRITLEQSLDHLRMLCEASTLPVNADFENAFADDVGDVAGNIAAALDTGIAGVSIEDKPRGGDALYPFDVAVARVAAARSAIAEGGAVLVGRCEGYITETIGLDEVIERLRAYANAGADCLYAPFVEDLGEIERIVAAVSPLPVNVLFRPGMNIDALARIGVRRVSLGAAFAVRAWKAFDACTEELQPFVRATS